MSALRKRVTFTLLKADNSGVTKGSLSITRIAEPFPLEDYWRAVLTIQGENRRIWGTRHREERETASNLLSRLQNRIADAEKSRVLELVQSNASVVQNEILPSTLGSQPRHVGDFIGAGEAARRRTPEDEPPDQAAIWQPSPCAASRCTAIIDDLYPLDTSLSAVPLWPTAPGGRVIPLMSTLAMRGPLSEKRSRTRNKKAAKQVARRHKGSATQGQKEKKRESGVTAAVEKKKKKKLQNQGVGVVVPEYSGAPQALNTQRFSPMFSYRSGFKRKVNAIGFEKSSQPTKKVARVPAGLREIEPPEKGYVAGLHYLLRKPLTRDGSQPSVDDDFEVPKEKPLLLFLHGSGERGHLNGTDLYKVRTHGPWQCREADGFFILAPQCAKRRVWPTLVSQVLMLLTYICERHDVDKSRVYISGLSMGAFGAWALAAAQPQMFAAIVSVSGGIIEGEMAVETSRAEMLRLAHRQDLQSCSKALEPCKNMPAWLFYGDQDKIVLPICSKHIVEVLAPDNLHVREIAYRSVGHACWARAFNTADLYTWLLEHSL